MGLLDRPDSTLLVVIFAVCVVGLLALAVTSLMPRIRGRASGGNLPEAYPVESPAPVALADRLAAPAPATTGVAAEPEPAADGLLPKPAAAKRTSTAAKRTRPTGGTTKRAPAKRSTQKPRPKD